jgi:tetratricopeptide (TPR) repeat protein
MAKIIRLIMESNGDKHEKINDFLDKKLSPEEVKQFQDQLKTDKSLQEEVKQEKFIRDIQDYAATQDLRSNLKEWDKIQKKKRQQRLWILSIISLSIILVLWFKLWVSQDNTPAVPTGPIASNIPESKGAQEIASPEENAPSEVIDDVAPPQSSDLSTTENNTSINNDGYLVIALSSYSFELPSNRRSTRSTEVEVDSLESLLYEKIQLLDSSKTIYVAESIRFLNSIPENQYPNLYAISRKYLAHGYFRIGEYDNAAQIFAEEIEKTSSSNPEFDDLEWYYLLSLLPNFVQNEDAITELLDKMQKEQNYHKYQTQAMELESRLKSDL